MKSTDISGKVRKQIHARDKHCVVCGSHYGLQIAHVFVNRSHAGLGVVENLALLCVNCHTMLDNGLKNDSMRVRQCVEEYMRSKYDIDVKKLKYRKW